VPQLTERVPEDEAKRELSQRLAYAQSSEAGGDSIRSNIRGFLNAPSSNGIRSFSRKGPILQYVDWVDQARSTVKYPYRVDQTRS